MGPASGAYPMVDIMHDIKFTNPLQNLAGRTGQPERVGRSQTNGGLEKASQRPGGGLGRASKAPQSPRPTKRSRRPYSLYGGCGVKIVRLATLLRQSRQIRPTIKR